MSNEMHDTFELAVLGAGPIGLEAALYGAQRGFDVRVYEAADAVGAHVERWSHVELFSPWSLNRSRWGEATLRREGLAIPDGDVHPTGADYLEAYLRPLADIPELEGRIETNAEVAAVSRRDARKDQYIGDDTRAETPFVIAIDDKEGRTFETADAVIDATGTYRTPNGLGPGGLRADGEAELAERIEYHVPDVAGEERDDYADTSTLVVGTGYSAVTTLHQLLDLQEEAPGTEVHWLLSRDEPPYPERDDDPLPQRGRLAEMGNELVREGGESIDIHVGTIEALRVDGDDGPIEVRYLDDHPPLVVDRLVANVGYRPDVELFRDLQVHLCYATEGPMDLAATLIGGSGDCLDQSSDGVETLVTPEPNFFVLGSKSYGRNSNFLLKVGFEQVEQVLDHLTESVGPSG